MILLVDDEEQLRKMLATALRKKGYDVQEAPDAQQALAIAARVGSQIRILVTDICMPGIKGDELIRRLKAMCPTADVIATSGFGGGVLLPDSRAVVIAKPFTPTTLLAQIALFASERKRVEEL